MPYSQIALTREGKSLGPRVVSFSTDRMVAEHVVLDAAQPYEFSVTGSMHYLALHDLVMQDGAMSVGGEREVVTSDLRRRMTFLPAGVTATGWSHLKTRRNSFIAIHFDPEALPERLRRSSALQEPQIYFRDGRMESTLNKLGGALRRQDALLDLLSETICDLAMVELAALHCGSPESSVGHAGLSSKQIARIREYVDDNIDRAVNLAELANVVGLSKYHFARAFKASTGTTPYADVLKVKISKAISLLKAGVEPSVAASKTGFSSSAQMARTLKSTSGLSVSVLKKWLS
jgi:AraC family transcriptional regulator